MYSSSFHFIKINIHSRELHTEHKLLFDLFSWDIFDIFIFIFVFVFIFILIFIFLLIFIFIFFLVFYFFLVSLCFVFI